MRALNNIPIPRFPVLTLNIVVVKFLQTQRLTAADPCSALFGIPEDTTANIYLPLHGVSDHVPGQSCLKGTEAPLSSAKYFTEI